jgi:hypothetical protein
MTGSEARRAARCPAISGKTGDQLGDLDRLRLRQLYPDFSERFPYVGHGRFGSSLQHLHCIYMAIFARPAHCQIIIRMDVRARLEQQLNAFIWPAWLSRISNPSRRSWLTGFFIGAVPFS